MSNAGRLLDDDDLPPPRAAAHREWARTNESRMPPRDVPRLPAPETAAYAPPLHPAQRACYEALSLALQEGHVFAAVTGPAASGKTMVLDSVLSDRQNRSVRCIRISDPDKVPARLAAQIEEVAYAEAGKPENLERHVVLAVDDAHTASDDLLQCLARLAAMREPGRRVPQVLLVGRPELWHRLASEQWSPLARRIAIRAALPALEEEVDPWASLEAEVAQTMSEIRAESALAFGDNAYERDYSSNLLAETDVSELPLSSEPVPPPMEYALFPDPPPRSRSERRESRLRLLVPLSCLAVGMTVFGVLLSYSYDWPDVFGDMPWSKAKSVETAPYVFSPQGPSHGLPRPPGWSQTPQKHSVAGSPNPYAPAGDKPASAAGLSPTSAPTTTSTPAPVQTAVAGTAVSGGPTSGAVEHPSDAAARRDPGADASIDRTPPALSSPAMSAVPALVALPTPALPTPALPLPALAPPALQSTSASTGSLPAEPRPSQPVPSETRAAAPATAPSAHQVAGLPSPPIATRAAPLSAPVVAILLRRGEEQTALGDVFAARLLFERAAEAGSAQGALRLARTYDPAFLPPADSRALGDVAAAKRWYARAVGLGDKDAANRLKSINEGR